MQFTLLNVFYLIVTYHYKDNEQLGIGEWSFMKHKVTMIEQIACEQGFITNCLLFSPTLATTCFLYSPIWVATRYGLAFIRYDMEETEVQKAVFMSSLQMAIVTVMIYYIMQIRELRKFF